jgi:hypothetical protein
LHIGCKYPLFLALLNETWLFERVSLPHEIPITYHYHKNSTILLS